MSKAKKLFVPIILGTPRQGRKSEHVAKLIFDRAKEHDAIEPKLFDVRDFQFPKTGYGQEIKDQFPEYRDAVIKADGFILVAPEYNHSFPGSLKSVIDLMLPEYIHKAVALCGVSAGGFGGTRVIEQMVNVVRELGMVVTFSDLNVSKVGSVFSDDGELLNEKLPERIDMMLGELAWMALSLRWGRGHIESKYHKCAPECEHLLFI